AMVCGGSSAPTWAGPVAGTGAATAASSNGIDVTVLDAFLPFSPLPPQQRPCPTSLCGVSASPGPDLCSPALTRCARPIPFPSSAPIPSPVFGRGLGGLG